MSTKTTFKRIALATVAVMGFGLLSVAPAQAALIYSSPNVTGSVGSAALSSTSIIINTSATAGEVAGSLFFTSSTETALDFIVTGFNLAPALNIGGVTVAADAGAPGGTYVAGTIDWLLDAGAGATSVASQIRLDIANDQPAAAGATIKICSAVAVALDGDEACTAASTISTITVAAAAGTATQSMFAVAVPNASTSYASAGSAVVTQSASVGGYVEIEALVDVVLNAAPGLNLITVTGGTIAAEGAINVLGDYLFNGAGGIASGATQAILTIGSNAGTSLLIATPTTGSVVVRYITRAFTGGVSTDTTRQTFTINVNTSAATYQYATATMTADNTGFVGGDDILYAPAAASIAVGNINVAQFNALNTALSGTNAKAVVVTLSGTAGSLASAVGGAVVTTATTVLNATPTFSIFGSGTSGTSTVTVAVNGVAVKTLTVKFYGAAAKVEASATYEVARAGNGITGYAPGADDNDGAYAGSIGGLFATSTVVVGEDQDTAIAVLVTDASGIPVPSVLSVTSSNPLAIAPALLSFVDSGDGDGSAGVFYNHYQYETTALAKSGDKATLTFSVTLANGTLISDSVDLSVGGTKTGGTVTMTLDKASYEPGERMILTFTGKDAAGNPVHDKAAVGTLSSNKAITNLTAAQGAFINGSRIYGDGATELIYAPAASGPFTITLATGTAAGATITATATVGDDAATSAANAASDAAAEAIDAANAATDAANLAAEAADAATVAAEEARDAADAATAAVEALATEVATLMAALKAQITTLANVVAKIAKRTKS